MIIFYLPEIENRVGIAEGRLRLSATTLSPESEPFPDLTIKFSTNDLDKIDNDIVISWKHFWRPNY